jgi:hypothetical protein
MHCGEASLEGPQPLTGELQGRGVTVDPDHPRQGATGQHRLGVAPEPEGRVDECGAFVSKRGHQESDDPVEHDRVVVGAAHLVAYLPRLVRSRKAPASAADVAAEKAITARASRAWCRTRLVTGASMVLLIGLDPTD